MPSFLLSSVAEADLDEIAAYTIERWSVRQADRYLEQIRETFKKLAENPFLGRVVAHSNQNLRRIEHGSHVIFYRISSRISGEGILIVRILHRSMLPKSQALEATEPNA